MSHSIRVAIGTMEDIIYNNIDDILRELELIGGGIELEDDNDGGYVIKKSSIDAITDLRGPAKYRLAKICAALLFDLPMYVWIDNRLIFVSAYETVHIMTNIGTKEDKFSLDYFKKYVAETAIKREDLDSPITDYENAKLVVSVLREHEIEKMEEDEWI